jgi:hypothetical protein
MKREDMTIGQLFELARAFPDELDGFLFEQKVS